MGLTTILFIGLGVGLVVWLAGFVYVFSYFETMFARGPLPRAWAAVASAVFGAPFLVARLVRFR